AVGDCKYVLLTTPQGGIINDPVLLRLGENHFWLSLSDWDVLFWCKGVAVNAGLDVVVREPDVSPLQLQGPKSKDVMVDLFGEEILTLEYYHLTETQLDGIPLVITRTGWSAERGYELYLRDARLGEKLWDAVMGAGAKYDIRPVAPSEIRRIEAGILNYSSDIMLDNNPYEVGLGWTVDEDKKSDYLGKAALARVKEEGVKRKLVGIEVEGSPRGAWIPDYWVIHSCGDEADPWISRPAERREPDGGLRPRDVAGRLREGDPERGRVRPADRIPPVRCREAIRERTGSWSRGPGERDPAGRDFRHDQALEQRPWLRVRLAGVREESPRTRPRLRRSVSHPLAGTVPAK